MLGCKLVFCMIMEDQVPYSIPPQITTPPQNPLPGALDPAMLESLKERARQEAIRITMLQRQDQAQEFRPAQEEYSTPPQKAQTSFQVPIQQSPQVVYVRRNLTIAELILVFAMACGLVLGVQGTWHFATNILPRVEIKMK